MNAVSESDGKMFIAEPLRDVIGRAIYSEDNPLLSDWYTLSETRREPWRKDADRVIAALLSHWSMGMQRAAEESGTDFLASSPRELWQIFLGAA